MTPCIDHTGFISRNGYGRVKRLGKTREAHRWAWEERYGAVPDGMVVMHLCHRRSCVNIEHLAVGTQGQNIQASVSLGTHNMTRKQSCPSGHPYTEENTKMVNTGRGKRGRRCLTCYPSG
ncbi:MAG: HNH endonuclease signature motif containing protein [Dehalococcoidia bacterium]